MGEGLDERVWVLPIEYDIRRGPYIIACQKGIAVTVRCPDGAFLARLENRQQATFIATAHGDGTVSWRRRHG